MPSHFLPLHLKLNALACRRGDRLLFHDLSRQVENGTILEIRGPNGIGKSSLIRILAGLLKPDAGHIQLSVDNDLSSSLNGYAHYLGHLNGLKSSLSVAENLNFWRNFEDNSGLRIEEALDALLIPHLIHLPAGVLSAGQKRRVAFARLLVTERPIWLLDEPTAALDKKADTLIGGLMEDHLSKGGLILAATHLALRLQHNIGKSEELHLDDFVPPFMNQEGLSL